MDIVHLIQSAVAPVFLLSGVGVTLGVLTNRLARIVDRARAIEDRIENRPGSVHNLHEQLEVLARRSRYINTAITMCAIAALLVALVVITLFANAFFSAGFAATIAILFVGAMVFLTAAFVTFLVEVRIATAHLRFGAAAEHALPPPAHATGVEQSPENIERAAEDKARR
jgi:Protein of unknown function (DUF2721)